MTSRHQRTSPERPPAERPRGSWLADEYAAAQRPQGTTDAQVAMDLPSDQLLEVPHPTPQ